MPVSPSLAGFTVVSLLAGDWFTSHDITLDLRGIRVNLAFLANLCLWGVGHVRVVRHEREGCGALREN